MGDRGGVEQLSSNRERFHLLFIIVSLPSLAGRCVGDTTPVPHLGIPSSLRRSLRKQRGSWCRVEIGKVVGPCKGVPDEGDGGVQPRRMNGKGRGWACRCDADLEAESGRG